MKKKTNSLLITACVSLFMALCLFVTGLCFSDKSTLLSSLGITTLFFSVPFFYKAWKCWKIEKIVKEWKLVMMMND